MSKSTRRREIRRDPSLRWPHLALGAAFAFTAGMAVAAAGQAFTG